MLQIRYIMPHDLEFLRYHWNVVFPIKVLINYHTKEFDFINSLHYLISKDNFILGSQFFYEIIWSFVFYLHLG